MDRRSVVLLSLFAALAPVASSSTPVWRRLGPDVAPIRKIVFAHDGRTVWLATTDPVPPQVYRSRDHGATWTRADGRPGDQPFPEGYLYDLVGDPGDPDVAWAAVHSGQADEVVRTTDGGATWSRVHAARDDDLVAGLFVDRQGRVFGHSSQLLRFDPGQTAFVPVLDSARAVTEGPDGTLTVLTWDPTRLYRSGDGGDHWQLVRDAPDLQCGYWLVADPLLPGRLWTNGCTSSSLLRSDDGGMSFIELDESVRVGGPVVIDPRSSDVLFAPGPFFGPPHFIRSTDSGQSWKPWAVGVPLTGGDFQVRIALDPNRPDRALIGSSSAGGIGVFRTDNRGVTWREVTTGLRGRVDEVSADVRKPDRLWAVVSGTLFDRADVQAPWRRSPVHTTLSQEIAVYRLIGSRVEGATLWADTNGGLLRTDDAGETWRVVGPALFASLVADPRSAETLYSIAYCQPRCLIDELVRSDDGGVTWTSGGLELVSVEQVVAHPWQRARRALVGSVCVGLNRFGDDCEGTRAVAAESTDGGHRWRKVNLRGEEVAVVYAAAAPHPLLVATSRGLFRRGEESGTWERLDRRAWVALLAGKRQLYGLVRAADGTVRVLRSGDDGVTWRKVETGLESPLSALRLVPGNPDRVYAATPTGVYALGD